MRRSRSACVYGFPVGEIGIVEDGEAIVQIRCLAGASSQHVRGTETALICEARRQLLEYFDRERTSFDLPIRPKGNKFQQRVWRALLGIPCGETRTYLQIANELEVPDASRLVGAACASNPLAIVIPCHRVAGAGGGLIGHENGLALKRYLQDLERSYSGPQNAESLLNRYERECARFVREQAFSRA